MPQTHRACSTVLVSSDSALNSELYIVEYDAERVTAHTITVCLTVFLAHRLSLSVQPKNPKG
jgi:hypothetical protein